MNNYKFSIIKAGAITFLSFALVFVFAGFAFAQDVNAPPEVVQQPILPPATDPVVPNLLAPTPPNPNDIKVPYSGSNINTVEKAAQPVLPRTGTVNLGDDAPPPVVAPQSVAPLNGSAPNTTVITDNDYDNINSSKFRLLICDGPPWPDNVPNKPANYEPCDFRGLMKQIQHLLNIAVIAGVLIAMGGFIWAGALYISGSPDKIKKAHQIFPSVFWGFIIMLSAWFIVYQILSWLTDSETFGVLLG
jgi:hypothetical protein